MTTNTDRLSRLLLTSTACALALFAAESPALAAQDCTQAELDDALARYNATVIAQGAQADASSVDSCQADDDIVTFIWNAHSSMTVVCFDDIEGCNIEVLQGSAATPDLWGVSGREDDGQQSYYHLWSVAITDLSVIGSASDDWISSLAGMASTTPSRVAAGGGDDIVLCGPGDDIVRAGSGDDTVFSGAGDDYLRGSNGHDWLDGGTGHDLLEGGNDDDYLFGGSGDDTLSGYWGEDLIYAGIGDDDIDAGGDDDIIGGHSGADTGTAGAGKDFVMGQGGADNMSGGEDDDVMIGGASIDSMSGAGGYDSCSADTHECEDSVSNRASVVAHYDTLELDHEQSNDAISSAAHTFSSTVFADVANERAVAESDAASFRVTIGALIGGSWL